MCRSESVCTGCFLLNTDGVHDAVLLSVQMDSAAVCDVIRADSCCWDAAETWPGTNITIVSGTKHKSRSRRSLTLKLRAELL